MAAKPIAERHAVEQQASKLLAALQRSLRECASDEAQKPVGLGFWNPDPNDIERLRAEATLLRRWLDQIVGRAGLGSRASSSGHLLAVRSLWAAADKIDLGEADRYRHALYQAAYLLGAADAQLRADSAHRRRSATGSRGGGARAGLDKLIADNPEAGGAELARLYESNTGQTVTRQFANLRLRKAGLRKSTR